ncbi:MAG: DNA helicase [Gammaproteobacteria bacterium]|nr:MAG: DNA helicase [Gammaproteobacteria bacterium]
MTPQHKIIKNYYQELQKFERANQTHEGTVKQAFQHLLEAYSKSYHWILIQEQTLASIRLDGTLFDESNIPRGYWEAKDSQDNLEKEVQFKLYEKGYPQDNIVFQSPNQAILIQNGAEILNVSLTEPKNLVTVLDKFFNFKRPEYDQWDAAAAEFKERVPDLGKRLLQIIRAALAKDKAFKKAFNHFANQCRQAINPNLADAAIEEMLIQHLLTERIFRKLFDHPDFAKRNIIAREIEGVIEKLTEKSFNRDAFFADLQYFYKALETVAATISEYSYKQHFLNTIYERFFQGFSVKVADTHGIVYTPQPIVDFMVRSVEEILQREFGKSLVDRGVHILDPFVGTGNFITRIIREIRLKGKMKLDYKYQHELHCNEVMLLPYYLACMNIEHQYLELMQKYRPFAGICLADTFELAEDKQQELFTPENTERVKQQKATDFFVIIGNPPYNAWQVNENDNNKNQTHTAVGNWVRGTYAKDSKATLKNALSDPYVKAIKWASERVKNEGIVAFVTNNSFLEGIAFDGMRKHLAQDFSKIYVLDLKGNVRKDSMRDGIPIGEKHTIFGLSAMVGISVAFFVKSNNKTDNCQIYYSTVDWKSTRQEKFQIIEQAETYNGLERQLINPNKKHTWLTEGLHSEFDEFIPLGTKETKVEKVAAENVVFKTYSGGMMTGRDAWAYNFNQNVLIKNVQSTINVYNEQVSQWLQCTDKKAKVDDFVLYNDKKISWSSTLKNQMKNGKLAQFTKEKIRNSSYRHFTKCYLYFDKALIDRTGQFLNIFPTLATEDENRAIGCTNHSQVPFIVQMINCIPDVAVGGRITQCFPFYTYNEDGTNRTENITDWALSHWQQHYQDKTITKWNIFYYVYALLHHPHYREKYAKNLKRELPRLPLAPKFWDFSNAGKQLADLHLNYEQVEPYPLEEIENPKYPFSLEVEKMRLSKDKTQLIYNNFLILKCIPIKTFDYKLGNRSALEWVVDQYRIKTDKRSGIINNPNRKEDEYYIIELIKKIITVSIETQKIVEEILKHRVCR